MPPLTTLPARPAPRRLPAFRAALFITFGLLNQGCLTHWLWESRGSRTTVHRLGGTVESIHAAAPTGGQEAGAILLRYHLDRPEKLASRTWAPLRHVAEWIVVEAAPQATALFVQGLRAVLVEDAARIRSGRVIVPLAENLTAGHAATVVLDLDVAPAEGPVQTRSFRLQGWVRAAAQADTARATPLIDRPAWPLELTLSWTHREARNTALLILATPFTAAVDAATATAAAVAAIYLVLDSHDNGD